ncbi:MAG TPA: SRPBCC domain-containing protein [Thermoleophilaceae bacterium]
MEHAVERELVVPDEPERVWESLAQPEWLGENASIELEPAGEVRAGTRSGFVEEVDAPRRLTFWWNAEGEESTRVELELLPDADGTRVRVVESRPLALLDAVGPDLALELRSTSHPGTPELLAH